MFVQWFNSRCALIAMVPTSWTTIDYGIRPVGATAVTDRTDRQLALRRGCCTVPVRNPHVPGLPIVQSMTIRMVRREIDRRGKRRYNLSIAEIECHAPEGPSIVEYRCWMQVRAAAFAMGCARMMHYPGRNDSAPHHPGDFRGRSAGDRGVGEAQGAVGK